MLIIYFFSNGNLQKDIKEHIYFKFYQAGLTIRDKHFIS